MGIDIFSIIARAFEIKTFSGPIAVFICYQFLKIATAGKKEELKTAWESFTSIGAEINIICIPILLDLWGDKNTLLSTKYANNPFIIGFSFILLMLSAVFCLWTMKKFRTKPDKRYVFDFFCSFPRLEKYKVIFDVVCEVIRGFVYFTLSIGVGLSWLLNLYTHR